MDDMDELGDTPMTDAAEIVEFETRWGAPPVRWQYVSSNFTRSLERALAAATADLAASDRRVRELEAQKDDAYAQRNHLVAALASVFPSGIRATNIVGWDHDWHGCCFIDLPTGQVSYHYHDSQAHLFAGLPDYTKPWDGHEKEDVHARLRALLTKPPKDPT